MAGKENAFVCEARPISNEIRKKINPDLINKRVIKGIFEISLNFNGASSFPNSAVF